MLLTGAMQPLHLDGDVEQTTLLALGGIDIQDSQIQDSQTG